jgi:quinol monooxygenase YgiN
MITVTAKITAKSGEKNKIISKSRDLIESTRLESGCISYNLYASTEDENTLLMFEQWENRDVLDLHMQTEHFKAFNASIENILENEVDIAVYSVDKA